MLEFRQRKSLNINKFLDKEKCGTNIWELKEKFIDIEATIASLDIVITMLGKWEEERGKVKELYKSGINELKDFDTGYV